MCSNTTGGDPAAISTLVPAFTPPVTSTPPPSTCTAAKSARGALRLGPADQARATGSQTSLPMLLARTNPGPSSPTTTTLPSASTTARGARRPVAIAPAGSHRPAAVGTGVAEGAEVPVAGAADVGAPLESVMGEGVAEFAGPDGTGDATAGAPHDVTTAATMKRAIDLARISTSRSRRGCAHARDRAHRPRRGAAAPQTLRPGPAGRKRRSACGPRDHRRAST